MTTNDPIANIDFRPLSGPVIVWHKPPHKIGTYEVYASDPNGRPQGTQSPRIEDRAAGDDPHEMFEQFIAEAISKSPEPLRELGEYLTRVLDDDHFKTAERYLLALASATIASTDADICDFCRKPLPDGCRSEFSTEDACKGYATPSAAVGEGVPVAWWCSKARNKWDAEGRNQTEEIWVDKKLVETKEYADDLAELGFVCTPLYTTPANPTQDTVLLSELLAVLHQDGGHYQAEHGTEKAVKDAIDAFYAKPGYMVVPAKMVAKPYAPTVWGVHSANGDIVTGWNACREAMLNATQGGKGEGDG